MVYKCYSKWTLEVLVFLCYIWTGCHFPFQICLAHAIGEKLLYSVTRNVNIFGFVEGHGRQKGKILLTKAILIDHVSLTMHGIFFYSIFTS